MAQRIARAATQVQTADVVTGIARFAIVAGSAAALILAGQFLPF